MGPASDGDGGADSGASINGAAAAVPTGERRSPFEIFAAAGRATAFPLLLLVVLGGFLLVQRWIDRGDPKLTGRAGWPDRDLRFE